MASAVTEKVQEWRKRVMLAPLPEDFLRVNISVQQQQEAADRQTAIALHHQLSGGHGYTTGVGRLNITVAQAKLAKNYGLTRMDPYARVRVGHNTIETAANHSGGKNPQWNKVMQFILPQGINSVMIEIFDERSFTEDELIAWTQFQIPEQVLRGETHEEWLPLTGKQGDGLEGMIYLVLSYAVYPSYRYAAPAPVMIVPNVSGGHLTPLKVYTAPVENTVPILNEAELKQIEEMFPNIDKEVIKTVFEANRGSKDGTINSLIQMAE